MPEQSRALVAAQLLEASQASERFGSASALDGWTQGGSAARVVPTDDSAANAPAVRMVSLSPPDDSAQQAGDSAAQAGDDSVPPELPDGSPVGFEPAAAADSLADSLGAVPDGQHSAD